MGKCGIATTGDCNRIGEYYMEERKEQTEKRSINTIGMFDLSKGVLMAFVVFGHSFGLFVKYWERENMPWWLLLPIVLFGILMYGLIPMFFMMSGYGFRKQKMKRCLADRARYLLKPYLWVAGIVTILAVLKAVMQRNLILDALKYQSFPFLLGLCPGETRVFNWYTASIGPMWFLVALGIAWVVLNILFQMDNEVMRAVSLVSLIAVCTQLPFYSIMPFCIAQSLCCTGYLCIGYYAKKNRVLTNKFSGLTYVIFVVIVVGAILFGTVDVSQNVWELGFFDYIASAVAGVLLCKAAMRFEHYEGKIARFFRLCGRNSLYILCVHTVEYLVFPWERITERFEGRAWLGIIVVSVVRGLMISVGCFMVHKVVKFVKRNPARKRKG